MEDIAILHSPAQGSNQPAYLKSRAVWVARSHYIQYQSPAFLNDEIIAYTWVSTILTFRKLF